MSWTDMFPILSDEMVDTYCSIQNCTQRDAIVQLFEVEEVFNPQDSIKDLVAISLYWNPETAEQDSVNPDSSDETGISWRRDCVDPHLRLLLPVLDCAKILRDARRDVKMRVFLANNLRPLVNRLVEANCEVFLMHEESIGDNPGAMWSFLALEEQECCVTISEPSRAHWILSDIERTEVAKRAGLGCWRSPYEFSVPEQWVGYRPVNATHFGSNVPHPTRTLMEAFIWHNLSGTITTSCSIFDHVEIKIAATTWPCYGFHEWFLLGALFPRMASAGVMSFVSWETPPSAKFLAMDIEYCTWAHSDSELIYFPNQAKPWLSRRRPQESVPRVRPETKVYVRERRRIGAAQGIFNHVLSTEIAPFSAHDGSLPSLLARASQEVSERWWIDLNPRLRMFSEGSELFLDRRYEDANVVVTGYYFVRVTADIARWAEGQTLGSDEWLEGAALKVPKLEGPATMWESNFARLFFKGYLEIGEAVKPEVMLRLWMDKKKATIMTTTALQMGWRVR